MGDLVERETSISTNESIESPVENEDMDELIRNGEIRALYDKKHQLESKMRRLMIPKHLVDKSAKNALHDLNDWVNGVTVAICCVIGVMIVIGCCLTFNHIVEPNGMNVAPLIFDVLVIVLFSVVVTIVICVNKRGFTEWLLVHVMKRKFRRNEDKINVISKQMVTILREINKKTDPTQEGWAASMGSLYEWWKFADLPMNGGVLSIFRDEVSEIKRETRAQKISMKAYSSEMKRLDGLIKPRKDAKYTKDYHPYRSPKSVVVDGFDVSYDGDDPRIMETVDRVNKISHEMETIEMGSGRTFMAELAWPLESLVDLSDISKTAVDKREMNEIFVASLNLFTKNLTEKEERVSESQKARANQESRVLEGLLS